MARTDTGKVRPARRKILEPPVETIVREKGIVATEIAECCCGLCNWKKGQGIAVRRDGREKSVIQKKKGGMLAHPAPGLAQKRVKAPERWPPAGPWGRGQPRIQRLVPR